MKVIVDPWKCQGHLQCLGLAPELFRFDEEYSYAVAVDGQVPPSLEAAARHAEMACPEQAITIDG